MLGSSTENSRCDQPAVSVKLAGAGVHLLLTCGVPPLSPQHVPVACGSSAPTSTGYVPISPFTRLAALPILLRFNDASVVLPRFMYSKKAGMATAARMPMIATTIMSSIRVKPRRLFFFIVCSPSSFLVRLTSLSSVNVRKRRNDRYRRVTRDGRGSHHRERCH